MATATQDNQVRQLVVRPIMIDMMNIKQPILFGAFSTAMRVGVERFFPVKGYFGSHLTVKHAFVRAVLFSTSFFLCFFEGKRLATLCAFSCDCLVKGVQSVFAACGTARSCCFFQSVRMDLKDLFADRACNRLFCGSSAKFCHKRITSRGVLA